LESVQALKRWLETPHAKTEINNLGGYDTKQTGVVTWVN